MFQTDKEQKNGMRKTLNNPREGKREKKQNKQRVYTMYK